MNLLVWNLAKLIFFAISAFCSAISLKRANAFSPFLANMSSRMAASLTAAPAHLFLESILKDCCGTQNRLPLKDGSNVPIVVPVSKGRISLHREFLRTEFLRSEDVALVPHEREALVDPLHGRHVTKVVAHECLVVGDHLFDAVGKVFVVSCALCDVLDHSCIPQGVKVSLSSVVDHLLNFSNLI